MVVRSTFAPVNLTIAININKLDVARTIYEATVLELGLVSYAFLVNPVTLVVLAREIAEIEVAVGLEAPDFAIFLTSIVTVDEVVAIPVCHLSLIVADIECAVEVHITEFVTIVDGDFPTTRAERTFVAVSSRSTKHAWKFLTRSKHVLSVALEPVEVHIKFALEEAEVETNVGGVDSFPSKS